MAFASSLLELSLDTVAPAAGEPFLQDKRWLDAPIPAEDFQVKCVT